MLFASLAAGGRVMAIFHHFGVFFRNGERRRMSAAVLCVFSYGFFSTKFIKCWRCWRKMSKFEELVKKGADTPEPALVFPHIDRTHGHTCMQLPLFIQPSHRPLIEFSRCHRPGRRGAPASTLTRTTLRRIGRRTIRPPAMEMAKLQQLRP